MTSSMGEIDLFGRLGRLSAPLLGSLSVNIDFYKGEWEGAEDIFGGDAPMLRHLKLYDIQVPWDSGLLRNLETLHISTFRTTGASCSQLIRILISCSQLVDLHLCFDGADDTDETNLTLIELPSLKSVKLQLDAWTLECILWCIQIPNCERFVCSTQDLGNYSLPDHLVPIIHRAAQRSKRQYVDMNSAGTMMFYEARMDPSDRYSRTVKIDLRSRDSVRESEFTEWLMTNIPLDISAPFVDVSIFQPLDTGRFNAPALLRVMERLDGKIESLSLHDRGANIQDVIMPYLSKPYNMIGSMKWRLPSLRELRLHGDLASHVVGHLEQVILVRCTPPPVGEDGLKTEYIMPTKLERLDIHLLRDHCALEEVQRLEELVPCVLWNQSGS